MPLRSRGRAAFGYTFGAQAELVVGHNAFGCECFRRWAMVQSFKFIVMVAYEGLVL